MANVKIETGITGFDQRVQHTVKRLPSKALADTDEKETRVEFKNFASLYAAIRVRLKDFADYEKKAEIEQRLESARKTAGMMCGSGMRFISFNETAQRGAVLYAKSRGKPIDLSKQANIGVAAGIFDADFAGNENRALGFLRAFEAMARLFSDSPDDGTFLKALEEKFPPIVPKV
jgi:pimeloyl-CoA synthetase